MQPPLLNSNGAISRWWRRHPKRWPGRSKHVQPLVVINGEPKSWKSHTKGKVTFE